MPTAEDLEVIHQAGLTDEQNHWCTPEFGWDELAAHHRPFRLIKRFVITQASGKKRVIDDAASGGQSLCSRYGNKMQFCSAMQPCAHVQALAAAVEQRYRRPSRIDLWRGLPRCLPENPHESRLILGLHCQLSWKEWKQSSFQEVSFNAFRFAIGGHSLQQALSFCKQRSGDVLPYCCVRFTTMMQLPVKKC